MITLATGGTLKGKAGTASVISYTITGDVVTTTDAFQVLGQAQLSNTTGDLLTTTPVPSSTSYLIKEILGNSTSGSNIQVTFYVNGTGASNVLWTGLVPAGGSFSYGDQGWKIYDVNGVVQSVGSTGPIGNTGTAATIAAGTTSTLAPGSTATVTNVGSSSAATFNFGIPAGAVWYAGSAAPSTLHNNGDLYLRTSTGDVYQQSAGAWGSPIENITGPTGVSGAVQDVTAGSTKVSIGGSSAHPTVDVVPANFTGIPNAAITGLGTAALQPSTAFDASGAAAAAQAASQPLDTDLTRIAGLVPIVGQKLSWQSAGWTPQIERFNVADFGADGTGSGDVTIAIYNAIISSLITRTTAARTTVTTQTTATGTFSLPVAANSLAASGTFLVQTTTGTLLITYTGGGGTTTLTGCTVTKGTTGGVILNGSIIGTQANTSGALYPQGGEIYFPNGAYIVSSPIIIPAHGVRLVGSAPSQDSDVGSIVSTGSAVIYWNGAVGATVISYCPTWSGQSAIQGAYTENLFVDCANVAGIGIEFISCHQWKRINCTVIGAILSAYNFSTVVASWLGGAEAADCTRGVSMNSVSRQIDGSPGTNTLTTTSTAALNTFTGAATLALSGTPTGWPTTNGAIIAQAINQVTGAVMWYLLTYTGGGNTSTLTGVQALAVYANSPEETSTSNFLPTAKFFSGSPVRQAVPANAMLAQMSGSTTANTCCNTFIGDTGKYFNGSNWIGNSDSNVFLNNVYNLTSGGTGHGWDVQGSTLSGSTGASGSSRNNHWISGSAGQGGAVFRGTESMAYLQRATANRWDGYQVANGEPRATIGTGCELQITYNGALQPGVDVATQTATGNPATVGGAGTATTGALPSLFLPVPPQGLAVGTEFEFRLVLTKTAAGTVSQFGVKFGVNNSAADTTISTGPSMTGTAAAETAIYEGTITITALGSGTSAAAQVYVTPVRRSLAEAATTGWVSTVAAWNPAQTWTAAGFDSTVTNPGPAYIGLYCLANTGTIITVQPGSYLKCVRA